LSTAAVWVLLAMSIDPLKPECLHQRVAEVFAAQERCETSATAMRAAIVGTDTNTVTWECSKVQFVK
jgi:hypothetical protein